jgi:arginine kinase
MTPEQVISTLQSIKNINPDNLMARHFNADYFRELDAAMRQRFMKIIATGIENNDSQMGAYAMSPEDYDLFAPMLDPMIRDFHGIPGNVKIAQKHDWDTGKLSCNLGEIDPRLEAVSMRVRVARNISTFPLPGAMTRDERVALEELAAVAFAQLGKDPDYGGQYLSITPGSPFEIDSTEYDRRVAAHQMFKDMSGDRYLNTAGISADWPYGRGMYVSGAQDFLVWVGEEDHLRIMAMQTGGNLNALFERLQDGLGRLQELLPDFARSPVYGNVTSCPTNLGAGMRASLHMALPNLTSNGQDLSRVKDKAKALGLAVRGAGGEHSAAGEGGLVDISPSARLGVTEMEIMHRLYDGAAALWAIETSP